MTTFSVDGIKTIIYRAWTRTAARGQEPRHQLDATAVATGPRRPPKLANWSSMTKPRFRRITGPEENWNKRVRGKR